MKRTKSTNLSFLLFSYILISPCIFHSILPWIGYNSKYNHFKKPVKLLISLYSHNLSLWFKYFIHI